MTTKQKSIIEQAARAAAAAGVPGILVPTLDVAAVTSIWAKLMVDLARNSGHEIDSAFAAKTVAVVIRGVGGYVGGSKMLSRGLMFFPGAGLLGASAMNSALNYMYTKQLGKALAAMYSRPDIALADAVGLAAAIAPMLKHARA